MLRKLLFILCVLACPALASAQGVRYDGVAQRTVQGLIAPIGGATITVCTSAGTGTPCTPTVPTSPVTLCTDATCAVAAPNPFTADANGNFGMWMLPGTYKVSITAAGVTGQLLSITLPCSAGTSCVATNANNAFTGNNTHSGTETFCQQNAVFYVGGTNPCSWAGTDIVAQIGTAYAALPSAGGRIIILPVTGGGCYTATTTTTFNTVGKYLILEGISTPANGAGNTEQGVCINYTPSSGTVFTADWTPGTGGGNTPGAAFRNFTLINNQCHTVGGCGGSAVGIAAGGTNGGMMSVIIEGVKIAGFNVGLNTPNAISWGMEIRTSTFSYNVTGYQCSGGSESTNFLDSTFIFNATGATANGCKMNFNGGSVDNSSVVGLTCTNAAGVPTMNIYNVHFENAGTIPHHYISGTCNIAIYGGEMYDDNTTNQAGNDWMVSAGGLSLQVFGQAIQSSGETLSTAVYNLSGASVRAIVIPFNLSPSVLTTITGGTNAAFATVFGTQSTSSGIFQVQWEPNFKNPVGIGDAPFTPTSADVFHLRFNGNNFNGMRFEDTANVHTWDLGFPGGTTIAAARDITNSKQIWQYSFTTNQFTLPSGCASTSVQVSGGLPILCGITSQKSESAADTNVLTVTPPAVAGRYRLSFDMQVSAQNTATLGWTATWTDSNGSAQAPTNLALFQTGVAAPALTFTAATNGNYYADVYIDVNNSATAIVIKLTFTGTSFTAKVSATVERII